MHVIARKFLCGHVGSTYITHKSGKIHMNLIAVESTTYVNIAALLTIRISHLRIRHIKKIYFFTVKKSIFNYYYKIPSTENKFVFKIIESDNFHIGKLYEKSLLSCIHHCDVSEGQIQATFNN